MHRAWVVVLIGCGFQSPAGPSDATIDASIPGMTDPNCSTIAHLPLSATVCPKLVVDEIRISSGMMVDVDTAAETANPAGIGCAPLDDRSAEACVLAATSIVIETGATLSAHGARPLVLRGHTIDVQGTIDVASHAGGRQGPASDLGASCGPGTAAQRNGGGAGGTFGTKGGNGGDGLDVMDVPGAANELTALDALRGGCAGRSPDGEPLGGHGGGAVWLAVDAQGTLVVGGRAIINASGSSGGGGVGGTGSPDKRGGSGGGSGGLIVLQAPAIVYPPTSQIFANGGGGGGGGTLAGPGTAGTDPALAVQGGPGGVAGTGSPDMSSDGGSGFPAIVNGKDGTVTANGGGGGGGGAGVILVDSSTDVTGLNVSPGQVKVTR